MSRASTFTNQLGSSSGRQGQTCGVNVADTERIVSAVAGSALTLVGLRRGSWDGLLLSLIGGSLAYRGLTGHCALYQSLGVNTAGNEGHGPATSVPAGAGFKIEKTITVIRSPEELFHTWRQLDNLPHFFQHLESVQSTGGNRSHWVAKGPMGTTLSWDSEVFQDEPGRLIAWRSLPGSAVDTAGSVHFERAPGHGTEVRVNMKVNPPAGKLGATVAKLFGEHPEQLFDDGLRRFKQLMEAGEIASAAGPSGRQRQ